MTETFREAIDRLLRDAPTRAWPEGMGRQVPALTTEDIEAASQRINAVKATTWMQVSCCVLTDATGENHCTHPPYVPPPAPRRSLRQRLRSWLRRKRQQLGQRLGSWLVGEQLLTRDEYDQREDDW